MSAAARPTFGRVLLTGGARSGKSSAAEALLTDADATYVATAPAAPADPEWQRRIARHRARRPGHWTVVETQDVAGQVASATPDSPVLVDCLTLWLMARLDHHDAWSDPVAAESALTAEIEELATAVASCPGGLVLVTNEVGSGIVPPDPGSRLFADLLGHTNCSVAAQCDDVYLVVAGHVTRLQRGPR